MDKNTEIKFVGQPILKQVIGHLEAISIKSLVVKHNTLLIFKQQFSPIPTVL